MWNFLDEMMGGPPFRGPSHSEPAFSRLRFILDDDEEFWRHGALMEARIRDWIASRSLEMDECPPRPIDTRAVFSKCRKEVYRSKSCGTSAKSTPEPEDDCPVCLEKFVANQDLFCLPCNHKFHKDCLTPWIQSSHGECPCCRADILNTKSKTVISTPPPPPPPQSAATSNPGRAIDRPSSSYSNASSSSTNGRSGRREAVDIMSVLTAMEAALDTLGLRTC